MSMILESDILYDILPYVDLETVGKLFNANKLINNLCNNKHFWKVKFNNDHEMFVAKSDNWLYEYKCIVLARDQTIKFVNHFIKMARQSANMQGALPQYYLYIRDVVTLPNLDWIPNVSQLQLNEYTTTLLILGISSASLFKKDMARFHVSFEIHPSQIRKSSVLMSMNDFINYMTKLYYDYGNFIVQDPQCNRFKFTNYKLDKWLFYGEK